MDRGAWWVTVKRVTKIVHDLATKQEICTRKPKCLFFLAMVWNWAMISPKCACHWCLVHTMCPFCMLPCAVTKRTCWGKKSGRSSLAHAARVSLWGGESGCLPPCPTRGLLLGQHREGPLSLEGCHGPGSPQFMLGINWESDTTRQQQHQSPNYSKLRVRVFGKSQLPHAAPHFPPSGSKSRALFCVCFLNLLSTR